jgi:hypothetical protein
MLVAYMLWRQSVFPLARATEDGTIPAMRRRLVIICCALITFAAIVGFWPRGPAEPVYQGKPLSQWIEETWYDPVNPHGSKAIRALGTNALPWLMSEIGHPEPKWRRTLNRLTDKFRRNQGRGRTREDRVWKAMTALRELGRSSIPALPQLARYLNDAGNASLCSHAAWTMFGSEEAAIPYLLEPVNSTNEIIASAARSALGPLAYRVPAATPHVVQMLQSTNPAARVYAVDILISVKSHPELTVPALSAALSDPKGKVKECAAIILNRLQTNLAVVAELRQLMTGTNSELALTASNALHLLETTNSHAAHALSSEPAGFWQPR